MGRLQLFASLHRAIVASREYEILIASGASPKHAAESVYDTHYRPSTEVEITPNESMAGSREFLKLKTAFSQIKDPEKRKALVELAESFAYRRHAVSN